MAYSWQTLDLFTRWSMDPSAPWGDLSFDTLLLDRYHLKTLERALAPTCHNPGISLYITCVLQNDLEALFNELFHLLEALDLILLLDLVILLEVLSLDFIILLGAQLAKLCFFARYKLWLFNSSLGTLQLMFPLYNIDLILRAFHMYLHIYLISVVTINKEDLHGLCGHLVLLHQGHMKT